MNAATAALIAEHRPVIERALLAMYNLQDEDEKDARTTRWENYAGFNAADAGLLTRWAEHVAAGGHLNETQLIATLDALQKYRRQLESFRIDIPKPIQEFTSEERAEIRRVAERVIKALPDRFLIAFPYDPNLVSGVRRIPGVRFDNITKSWYLLDANSIGDLVKFATDYNFNWNEDAQQRLNDIRSRKLESSPAPAPVANKQIDLVSNAFHIRFRYDSLLVAAVKTIPKVRYDVDKKLWYLDRITPDGVQALRAFATTHKFTFTDKVRAWLAAFDQEQKEKAFAQSVNVAASSAADADIQIAGLGGTLRPFQRAGVAYTLRNKRTFIADDMGTGKAQPLDSHVLTPDGWVEMGSIEVGDLVFGPDGLPHTVLGVFPQGMKPVYRVEFTDGSYTECTGYHLWSVNTPVRNKRGNSLLTLTLDDMLQKGLKDKSGNTRYFVPMINPLQFPERILSLHPYVLGALLGNGRLDSNSPSLSSIDTWLRSYFESLLPRETRLKHILNGDYRIIVSANEDCARNMPNPVTRSLAELGINVKDEYKFVPDVYKTASEYQRKQLLAGLLDTDGSVIIGKKPTYGTLIEFSSVSYQLIVDVKYLVESLGGRVSVSSRTPFFTYKGERRSGQKSYRLFINLMSNPFLTPRKAERFVSPTKYAPRRGIVRATFVGEKPCQCITIDSPDSLYLTDNCIPTHNTVQALASIHAAGAYPAVVICPASLKYNWEREALKWLPGRTVSVINNDKKDNFKADVVIVNYDLLMRLKSRLLEVPYKTIVCDESQYIKNYKAQRTKMVEELSKNKPYRILLSGTPLLNRPQELISQLSILGRLDDLGGFWDFVNYYCSAYKTRYGWDMSGAAHLDELNEALRRNCYIRRTKGEVLKELPPKQRVIVPLDITNRAEYAKAEKSLADWIQKRIDQDTEFQKSLEGLSEEEARRRRSDRLHSAEERAKRAEELTRINATKQIAAQGKIEAFKEWVTNFVESGEKLVIFAWHQEVINELAKQFNADKITGDTPVVQRQAAVDRFQNDPAVKIIVCNIQAGGVGLTLTAASNVAFVELGWNPGTMDQAEDRCILEGQPVLTPHGWVPVEQIEVGDMVIAQSGHPRKVIDKWGKSNRKTTAEINLEGWYQPLVLTADHPFLTESGWAEAGNLRPGDRIVMPTLPDRPDTEYLPFPEDCRIDERFANSWGVEQSNGRLVHAPDNIYLTGDALFTFGYYVGDGSARTDGSKSSRFVSFAGNNGKKAPHLKRIIEWFCSVNHNKREDGNGVEYRFYSGEWAYWFAFQFGRVCAEKRIPEWVFECSVKQRKDFLSGMLASDGYDRGNNREYITTNYNLAAQCCRLVLACGYKPCITVGSTGQWIIRYNENVAPLLNVERVMLRHGRKSERVHDLTIEEESSFVVGTAVVHNCHRIGQNDSVTAWYFVGKDTIDETIYDLIQSKREVVSEATDGTVDDGSGITITKELESVLLKSNKKAKEDPVTVQSATRSRVQYSISRRPNKSETPGATSLGSTR